VRSLLPKDARRSVVDVFDKHKVFRVELRPPDDRGTKVRWLTVFDALAGVPGALAHANALGGSGVVGALLERGEKNAVVAAIETRDATYRVPARDTLHVLYDLAPHERVTIRSMAELLTTTEGGVRVDVARGAGPLEASDAGSLVFETTAAGAVRAAGY
jgi:hypothetical protein